MTHLCPRPPRRSFGCLFLPSFAPLIFVLLPASIDLRAEESEPPDIVAPGYFQIESRWVHAEDDEDGLRTRWDEWPSTLLRVGLVEERLELRLVWFGYHWEEVHDDTGPDSRLSGAGDAEIGFKLRLWEADGLLPQAAWVTHLSLPVGSDAYSTDHADPSTFLFLTYPFSDRWSWNINLGVVWSTEPNYNGGGETGATFFHATSLDCCLTDRLMLYLEFFGENPLHWVHVDQDDHHFVDAGVAYSLRDNLSLDLEVGVGVDDDTEDWFTALEFVWRLPR
ncbi:transporter [bacterium]|nr:transporter [bacterium]